MRIDFAEVAIHRHVHEGCRPGFGPAVHREGLFDHQPLELCEALRVDRLGREIAR